MSRKYDVLVVGAGPAGCTVAEKLARAGWEVALLESHSGIGATINCSGIISVEALERFRLPHRLIRHTIQSLEFHSPGGCRWRFEARKPLAHAVDRPQLDKLLGHRAMTAGAELLLGHRAVGVDSIHGGLEVPVEGREETGSRLRARAVVLATGAGVPILHKLGWGGPPERLHGVQSEAPLSAGGVEIYLGKKWAPDGFAWIMPLGERTSKVGLLCRRNGPDFLRQFLRRGDIGPRLKGAPGPILCSILPLGFLPRSYGDRLLVVGEAAGHIKATTCGGIYYGMLTAGLAAEVLDGALKDDQLDAGRLSSYEVRWRQLLEGEIETGMRLRRIFRVVPDSILDRLVALAGRDGIAELIHENVDFDWHRDLIRSVLHHGLVQRVLGTA